MFKKKCKKVLIKNRQVKNLPFLRFESFIGLEKKYKIYTEDGKKIHDELIEKKRKKRKKILSICSFALNITILAVVLIYQIVTGGANTIITQSVNWNFIGVLIGAVAGLILVDTLKIFIMIKASTKKSRPFLAYKTSALGRYYDNITPMSTGGQAFQIFYMNKRGIRGDVATGIPLVKYIMWQITYVIICTFVLIYNGVKFGSASDAITTTVAWVAISINIAIFMTVVLLSVSKRVGPRIVIGVLKLLAKMHIIKNYQKTFRKVMRFVLNYQKTFKTLLKNPFVLILELLLAATDIIVYNLIPFIVCLAFVPKSVILAKDITLFRTFIKAIICSLTLAFIPTPGSSGGAESIFIIIFGGLFGEKVFWPVLIWRIATYYVYLLQGLFVLIYDFFIGNRRLEKLKKAGAEIYNPVSKPSFKQTLDENMQTIEDVQTQEQDKIPVFVFTGTDKPRKNAKEVVENTKLVSDEELQSNAQNVDKLLLEDHLRYQERKQKRNNRKQQIKYKRKTNKKK